LKIILPQRIKDLAEKPMNHANLVIYDQRHCIHSIESISNGNSEGCRQNSLISFALRTEFFKNFNQVKE